MVPSISQRSRSIETAERNNQDNTPRYRNPCVEDRGELFHPLFLSLTLCVLVYSHPSGWPQLAAFLNSEDNFAIFRRFGLMHCRELVMLQAEITLLEKQRAELDKQDEASESTRYRLVSIEHQPGWDTEQKDLSEQIRKKLLIYGK